MQKLIYSVDEETEGDMEVCVQMISLGKTSEEIEVTLNTHDGTSSGIQVFFHIWHVL